jgi:hypothetical protein
VRGLVDDELLAQGRITQTYVRPLETASPDVAFVVGAHEAVIRPSGLVPGYVVPDGGQARPMTGVLSDGGPLVPGPAGSRAAWVMTSGSPTSPELSLITLTGHRSGPSIRFQPGEPQVPATAVSDGHLKVPAGMSERDFPAGGNANESSMVWSPDGRWLFVAAAGGKLDAVDTRTGRIEGLGVRLPAVDQVAIRP